MPARRSNSFIRLLSSLSAIIIVFAVRATFSLHNLWMMRPKTAQVEKAVLTTHGELQVYFQVGQHGMPALELRQTGHSKKDQPSLLKIQLPAEERYGTFLGMSGAWSKQLPAGGHEAYLLVDSELGRANTMSGYLEIVGFKVDPGLGEQIRQGKVNLCAVDPTGPISTKSIEAIQ